MTSEEIQSSREAFKRAGDVALSRKYIGLSQQYLNHSDSVEWLIGYLGADYVRRMVARARELVESEGTR